MATPGQPEPPVPSPEFRSLEHWNTEPDGADRLKRWLIRLLPTLVILAVAYVVAIHALAASWLFQPAPYPGGHWQVQQTYRAQDRWLTLPHGTRLNAWWVPVEGARRTALFFHSREGNISDQDEQIMRLRDTGCNVFLVDYPGYGKSGGRASIKAVKASADAAYQFVRESLNVPSNRLILVGDELGSALAAGEAAKHPQVAGLILLSPFPDLRTWANGMAPLAGWILGDHFHEAQAVRHYAGPAMVVYGDADSTFNAGMAQPVIAAFPISPTVHVVAGGTQGHLLADAGYDYERWLNDFFQANQPAKSR